MPAPATPAPELAQNAYYTASASDKAIREECLKLWLQLEAEYVPTWLPTHLDIIDYEQPNRGNFWPAETNRGTRKDAQIINDAAQDASGKLTSAMDTGITSEAREWFIVSVEDQREAEDYGVREYCHAFQSALYAAISKFGFYAPNRNVLEDVVGPAIGLMLIEEDKKTGGRCTHVPIGQYRVAADSRGEVNVVARRFLYTAEQMVAEFGEDHCSPAIRGAIAKGMGQTTKATVLHVIRERAVRDPDKIDARNMPWSSIWLEIGMGYSTGTSSGLGQITDPLGPVGVLRESGYNECPFYVPRWNQIGQNAYGTGSPGWKKLGDAKQLQSVEFGEANLLAELMDPAYNVPAGLKNASSLPGAKNYLPDNAKVMMTPTREIPTSAPEAYEKIVARLEQRINRGFYGDILFLLSADQRAEPKTAEEIRGIKEERLLQLGGVFSRIAPELRKALKRMAALAHRAGMLPPPPPKLLQRGLKLKIDFVNPLVTAQKAIAVTAIGQVISIGTAAATAKKEGFDNLDARKTMNIVADALGISPDCLFSDEEMAKHDQAQADAANSQQQAAALPEAAGAMKDLSAADPDKIRGLLSQLTPAAAAQGATTGS